MKNYPSWKVAAALIIREGEPVHYKIITERVIKSSLTKLGLNGVTPTYTLNRIMNSDHPEIFTNNGSGKFWIKKAALNQPDIKEILKLLEIEEIKSNSTIDKNYVEGEKKWKYATYYERNPKLREKAIELHGTICMVPCCRFNFEEFYGEHGKNFIEVHHIKPLSTYFGNEKINPATDLVVLCSNCHRMIHHNVSTVLTIKEMNQLILKSKNG